MFSPVSQILQSNRIWQLPISVVCTTWLSTYGSCWWCNFRQITFTVHRHAGSHHSTHRPSAWFMSFSSFGFIYQTENVATGSFKAKGLGEPGTTCPLEPGKPAHRGGKVKEKWCAQVALSCMQICVSSELKEISASARTLTSSLFSASKFIEKRHCFFKIALAVISGSVHCWGNRKRVERLIYGGRRPVAHIISGPAAVQAAVG